MTIVPFRTAEDVAVAAPQVAAHLSVSGLLAYPTETVYGLGSRPVDDDLAALASGINRTEKPATQSTPS